MDQKKMGTFLKNLRKNRGLTQEQLAEHFYVSSRTVSRWETGSNIPDVAMLMELATFYHVDIREIIDGEKKTDHANNDINSTLKMVAAYATEKEKAVRFKAVYVFLGITVLALACTILFAGEFKGLLYGIVPGHICKGIMTCVYGGAAVFLVSYLKACLWQEKPMIQSEQTVTATVISKEVKPGTHGAGRSKGGYSYVIRFLTEAGESLDLYAYEVEFGALKEGMHGLLTYRGEYFVRFSEHSYTVK